MKFIRFVSELNATPSAKSLASNIWQEYELLVKAAGMTSEQHVWRHLQQVVDVVPNGEFYVHESNTVDFSGGIVEQATAQLIKHRSGHMNIRSREPFDESLAKAIELLDVSQLLHNSVVDASTIICV